MTINQRIKEVRQALNLSQAKFASEISISSGYIASIELGNRNVNNRIVKLICTAFNVNDNWLKNGQGNMFNEQPTQTIQLATDIFKELKPEYQEYILKQIDLLLEIQNKEADNRCNGSQTND